MKAVVNLTSNELSVNKDALKNMLGSDNQSILY
jgi:hypothetical protein